MYVYAYAVINKERERDRMFIHIVNHTDAY